MTEVSGPPLIDLNAQSSCEAVATAIAGRSTGGFTGASILVDQLGSCCELVWI